MASMLTGARRAQPGWWIPWTFALFFLVVFAVNGVMIWLALASWTGLETTNPYERGLAYNRALEAARAQAALGWWADFRFEQTGARRGRIELDLRGRDGEPLQAAKVDALLVRPTEEGHDLALDLSESGSGRYVGLVELPLAGQWEVRLAASAEGKAYRLSPRIYLRP